MELEIKRISFSEFKNWTECPYRHKLIHIDKLPYYSGNEYTAFGTAIHQVCEHLVTKENLKEGMFETLFSKELDLLSSQGITINDEIVQEMNSQAKKIISQVLPSLKNTFGKFEVFSVEEPLLEDMNEITSYDKKFKGFIDLVIKTPDEKYHVIDWKSCSWGWRSDKKNDKITGYQLIYYKNFFAKKHNIDPKKIDVYFALLKRTAKKDNVEIFKITSGPKKTTNALKVLENAVINIEKGTKIKNRLSCKYCKFHNTESCT